MSIMKINKDEGFSPWQQDCVTMMRIILSPRVTHSSQTLNRTINPSRESRGTTPTNRKKTSKRPFLSMTKIDFYKAEAEIKQNQPSPLRPARRYEGPRLNFYLKMNPKKLGLVLPQGEKISMHKTIERESLVSTNASNGIQFPSYRTLEQAGDKANRMKNTPSSSAHLKFSANANANVNSIKKMKDEYRNMKKLKLLHQSRIRPQKY